jgi:hypothetical protein
MMIWLLLAVSAAETVFPERTPAMIESCLNAAVTSNEVSETDDAHKYICMGQVAEDLWSYLEKHNVEAWEQTTDNGVWLSREFPLGGCFKRIRHLDGSAASDGLSCTIWVPRLLKTRR